jgi:hypothetical protein
VELGKESAASQQEALEAARDTLRLAEEPRQAAELGGERARLERIHELVEEVFRTSGEG